MRIFRRMHPFERAILRGDPLPDAITRVIARVARSAAKDAVQDVMESQGIPFYSDATTAPTDDDPAPFITERHRQRCPVQKFDADGVTGDGLVHGLGCSRWRDHTGLDHRWEIPVVANILEVSNESIDPQ